MKHPVRRSPRTANYWVIEPIKIASHGTADVKIMLPSNADTMHCAGSEDWPSSQPYLSHDTLVSLTPASANCDRLPSPATASKATFAFSVLTLPAIIAATAVPTFGDRER